ncbi:cobyrinate a,c-diamide synthase [Catellatospora citrea]|uniref:Hydrogenobyrinate a,c-diamide synthase n=1 Tax=Catellatospora citrea TaxID=53366 RepID=A0A8J3KAB8_9ACTN|nr:cobyrinate a,c-diamide synthase [Catellatospora citrea]RKE07744.1 cobyrinic acid a,c-diamide synthase [Catellatospora citrea]GIF99332.1 hydrogenobyrinate a,c-diamide synthase [Catellatospora citrea]
MVRVPRVVIAAAASGHGKTTVATGLLAALTARGMTAAGFKVGPDYIDPTYHSLACGRPGRNLDPSLVGEDLVAPLFAHGAAGAQVAVVEGVMGLYDGRSGEGDFGSTAHVARLLDAPVVFVVDATGQGRSVAALLHGFRSFGSARLAGVVLNRVGSDRHEQILREACEEVGTPVLGVLRRAGAVAVPSRHLGLVPAAERSGAAVDAVAAMGALVEDGVDLGEVLAVAHSAPPLAVTPWSAADAVRAGTDEPAASDEAVGDRPVIAVAGGPAFTFGYAEQAELLRAAGAEVVHVDPLRAEALPRGTAGLVVGGGFPEVYGDELAANKPLRDAVRELAAAGAPVAAECAGLLWLARSLDGREMCGVLDAEAVMTERLTLGYRDAVAVSGSVLADAGTRVTGHEFHRTAVTPAAGPSPAWAWRGQPAEGFVQGGVHASYLHLHWAGQPGFARRMVRAACA